MALFERYVSPEGSRIALLDLESDEVWLMSLQSPAEAEDLRVLVSRWRRLRPRHRWSPLLRRQRLQLVE